MKYLDQLDLITEFEQYHYYYFQQQYEEEFHPVSYIITIIYSK